MALKKIITTLLITATFFGCATVSPKIEEGKILIKSKPKLLIKNNIYMTEQVRQYIYKELKDLNENIYVLN